MTDRTSTTPPSGRTPAPDERELLRRSVDIDVLRLLTDDAMADLGVQPSAPTTFIGAPDLGHGWLDADSRPAAWRAFGEA